MTTKQKYLLVATLLFGTFCMFLNQTLLTTAYPSLMKDFSISTDYVQWLTTGFLLVTGITIPISGWLLHQINTKHLYIFALVVFLFGTTLCYFSTTFLSLLLGRMVQAIGVGISMPLFQTVLLSLFPKNQRGSIMGLAGIVIGLAPAIGPTLSGFILLNYSWHTLFLLLIPLTLLVILMAVFFMKPVLEITKTRLDVLSVIESSLGLGLLLYGLSIFSMKKISKLTILFSIAVGLCLLVLFILRQKKSSDPFLSLQPFNQKDYQLSCLLVAITNMAMISFELVIPMYIQNVRHLSPLDSGLVLLPGALILGVMSPISGRLFDRYGARKLCIIGMFLLTSFTFPFIFIRATTPMSLVSTLYALRLLGIAMVMMPITTFGMNALPNSELGASSVINKTAKQVASSLGTAVMVSVMTLTANLSTAPSQTTKLLKGYQASFFVATLFCLIAFFFTLKIEKNN